MKFNELGEWANARASDDPVSRHPGHGLEQYLTGAKQVIVYPAEYKDGELRWTPFRQVSGAARRCIEGRGGKIRC